MNLPTWITFAELAWAMMRLQTHLSVWSCLTRYARAWSVSMNSCCWILFSNTPEIIKKPEGFLKSLWNQKVYWCFVVGIESTPKQSTIHGVISSYEKVSYAGPYWIFLLAGPEYILWAVQLNFSWIFWITKGLHLWFQTRTSWSCLLEVAIFISKHLCLYLLVIQNYNLAHHLKRLRGKQDFKFKSRGLGGEGNNDVGIEEVSPPAKNLLIPPTWKNYLSPNFILCEHTGHVSFYFNWCSVLTESYGTVKIIYQVPTIQ